MLTVYGSDRCGFTVRLLRRLTDAGVPFAYVDVDADPEAEARIAGWNAGRAIRPTVELSGRVLINPDPGSLIEELREAGRLAGGEEG